MSDALGSIARVVAILDSVGAQHMIVGSFASTFHGEPRTTQDVDLVVEISAAALERFLAGLDPRAWYFDAAAARAAVERRAMFNVIDLESGWKLNLIVRKATDFAQEEFRRRIPADLAGVRACVATAEDTILSKLVWARDSGGSERQMRDVAGIVAAAGEALDVTYIDRWAATLGVTDLWRRVRD